MSTTTDYTPTGLRVIGPFENDRNGESSQLFKDIIREVFNAGDVIIAHHLVYVAVDKRSDGFEYQIVEEIPSADALIFNHDVAKKLWGMEYKDKLVQLALEPIETRDKLFGQLYYGRIAKAA